MVYHNKFYYCKTNNDIYRLKLINQEILPVDFDIDKEPDFVSVAFPLKVVAVSCERINIQIGMLKIDLTQHIYIMMKN